MSILGPRAPQLWKDGGFGMIFFELIFFLNEGTRGNVSNAKFSKCNHIQVCYASFYIYERNKGTKENHVNNLSRLVEIYFTVIGVCKEEGEVVL